MMGLAVPLEDTLVKKPVPTVFRAGELVTSVSDGAGEVSSFHTMMLLPPLLTTRAALSLGSTKYDSPHQHWPMAYVPSTLFVSVENPPRSSSFMKNMDPTLPAATARCGIEPGWSGRTITPPDPKSRSCSSMYPT